MVKTTKNIKHKRDNLGRFADGNHPKSEFKKGNKSWNYGLTKETDERVRALSENEERNRKIGKASIDRKSVKNAHEGWIKWYEDNPEEVREHMNTIGRTQRNQVTSIELKVRNYLTLLKIIYFTNVYNIKGTPDIVIPNNTTGHPICIFVDGCYWHKCKSCFNERNIDFESFETSIEIRHRDNLINEELSNQGFIVNRIWEHDIKNGNYKKIIKNIIKNNNIGDNK